MFKVGQFIYPWGSGHYSRMMRLDAALGGMLGDSLEVHYSSKGHVYDKLRARFPGSHNRIHEVLMPTPIDGSFGPSLPRSLANVLLPVAGSPPLVRQIAGYLRQERRIYDAEQFDLVINDGDMGSNVLARNRGVPSLFVTNQFRPRLHGTRALLRPAAAFISGQIAKASRILVADSPPPYTMCEYNLNFGGDVADRVEYVGHFTGPAVKRGPETDLERLVGGADFGYWMRTGNRSTNEGTGTMFARAFACDGMGGERRVVSHARDDPSIDSVTGADGRRHTIRGALERKIDWVQIDVGFLSEQEKDTVLDSCRYAVVNGSHTAMGEIMGSKSRPIIGMPVYDEHTNNIRWAEERGLGVLAATPAAAAKAVARIRGDYGAFEGALREYSKNFEASGAENAAGIAARMLQEKR